MHKKKTKKPKVYIEDDADFVDYCLELAVQQGRIRKKGNLARTEDGESYDGDITYELVLN